MTSRPKAVVTHRVHEQVRQALSAGCDVVVNDGVESWPQSILVEQAADADALMAFMPDRIDAAFLASCPRLRVVAGAFKGHDNIDVEACSARGVWVTAVPDLLSAPTAEMALALVLGLTRNLVPGDRLVRSGEFQGWRPVLYGGGLLGKTVGVIGMGKVGRAFARLVSGFNARIIYSDPVRMPPMEEAFFGLSRLTLDDVLTQSDVVALMLPLADSTFHLINDETLGKMKSTAYLVNVGRGSVVDEGAVASALDQRRLAGYAADVFEMEDRSRADAPAAIHPSLLSRADRTMLTPHLGSAVDRVRLEIELSAARSMLQVLRGERPADAVNEPSLAAT